MSGSRSPNPQPKTRNAQLSTFNPKPLVPPLRLQPRFINRLLQGCRILRLGDDVARDRIRSERHFKLTQAIIPHDGESDLVSDLHFADARVELVSPRPISVHGDKLVVHIEAGIVRRRSRNDPVEESLFSPVV